MAFPKLSGLPSSLLILLAVLVTADPGISLQLEAINAVVIHFPPLLDYGPSSAAASSTPFRANLLSLLAALPSAAAAAPTAFAALQSRGPGCDNRTFARGLYFAAPSPAACHVCVSAAASDVATGCSGSRRGGAWRAGCFVAYADTNASSAHEDAFQGWFYGGGGGGNSSQCAGNHTSADCARCIDRPARVVPTLRSGHQLARVYGDGVVVVGYHCYLRVEIEGTRLPWWFDTCFYMSINLPTFALVWLGVLCVIRAWDLHPAWWQINN